MRPTATLQWTVPGGALGPGECEVTAATIHHGRGDPDTQPEASSLSADFTITDAKLARLDGLVIGGQVRLLASFAPGQPTVRDRFLGRVTDIRLGWSDPDTMVGQLTAMTALADMGRRIIGDEPWPSELDGARANRAINLAGVPTNAAQSDPGTVAILARDVDAQPALDVAADAALAGAGYVWDTRAGLVLYADAEHRRNAPVAAELTACDLPMSVEWAQDLVGLVNDVRVRYGPTPPGGEQAEVHTSDPASIAARGLFGASLSTALATVGDAQSRAGLIVARQANPVWGFIGSDLQLDTDFLPAALVTALLNLEVGALVRVTGLPAGSPYASALLWVEGWVETITNDAWSMALAVSDYCRSAGTVRWDETDPAVTWDNIGTQAWDSASCLPPRPPSGRWNDVPATLRWNGVPPTTTWNTWT